MATPPLPQSIFDLPPLEVGGVENRKGLGFQDHVAAGFCLIMLADAELSEVWCETQDDITLIWTRRAGIQIEFIQVKGSETDQLWSPAMLCAKEDKAIAKSILEKSLSNDRCLEPVAFRIVTLRPVNDELKILISDRDSKFRTESDEGKKKILALKKYVAGKNSSFRSLNGNDCEFWVDRTCWDERHSERAIHDANIRLIGRLIEDNGDYLTEDQKNEIYARLLAKVSEAGKASANIEPSVKKFRKTALEEWFKTLIRQALHPASLGTGEEAERKMTEAKLPKDAILIAQELRRSYRREVLRPQYLAVQDRRLIEGEVLAVLQRLKAQLDVGLLSDSGLEFHHRCIEELKALQESMGRGSNSPFMFFEGYMYNVVDRCLHRFVRATP